MESLKHKLILVLGLMTLSELQAQSVEGKKTVLGTAYFNQIFGHVHQNPSRYSKSLTAIACAHPVKVMSLEVKPGEKKESFAENWKLVKAGPYEGYIHGDYLTAKRPECFQDRYPRFVNELGLELTDMFYWGKLYDHYEQGRSQIP